MVTPMILFGDFTAEETQEGRYDPKHAHSLTVYAVVLAISHVNLPQKPKPFSWSNLSKPTVAAASHPSPFTPATPVGTIEAKPAISLEVAFEQVLTELDLHESAKDLQRRLLCHLSSKVGDISSVSSHQASLVGWKHLVTLVRELDEPTLAQQRTIMRRTSAAPVILSPYFLRLFQSANGMQHDALEFLEFLLEHLHVDYEASHSTFPLTSPSPCDTVSPLDGWSEIQKHGKAAAVHHNIVDTHSPITYLFKGTLRSELIRSTLKRTAFETLPVVLSLHVKRFTYDPVQGPLKLNTIVQWSLYDDDTVQYITKQAALAEHAYLLFYLRV
ncbi:hypothetical protein B5M09_012311 [Aphanomyces astaci]|uniref:ubiquitinyl hydrolase 1 n=1 Tax=Aphanomyces astaci TaxID=112090 RepID=A0A3R7X7I3_APHAT|nr:hypothetical protein B5M09_012311 [Aphanomyces astaci]